jgi:hypothetical protein
MNCTSRQILSGNEIKVDEMDGASGMQARKEICASGFGGEILTF